MLTIFSTVATGSLGYMIPFIFLSVGERLLLLPL
jgi:hypothetical protein